MSKVLELSLEENQIKDLREQISEALKKYKVQRGENKTSNTQNIVYSMILQVNNNFKGANGGYLWIMQ